MYDKNTVAVLEAAIAKNPLALKEALDAALAVRISAAIEDLKASMFSEGKDEDCDDEDDEDEDEDDEDEDDEELDEAVIDFVLDSILEAAEEAGVDLSEEELVELSKDTLTKYVAAAKNDKYMAFTGRGKYADREGPKPTAADYDKRSGARGGSTQGKASLKPSWYKKPEVVAARAKLDKHLNKRAAGIEKATNRLAK